MLHEAGLKVVVVPAAGGLGLVADIEAECSLEDAGQLHDSLNHLEQRINIHCVTFLKQQLQ